ncbi:MAG: ATP-binding cassette domain-containing protein [Cyanophyceae cyanobacterium]
MSNRPLLELRQVGLECLRAPLLQDISLTVFTGDRLAIVGPSGAGKTTLLRLLNRLSEPTSGAISLSGQPLGNVPVVQLRRQVVLVPQEPKLLGMTGQEALRYPLRLQQLSKAEIQQRLNTWTTKLNIPQAWLERTEHQLSLGQRQLVAIARALIMQPQVLLLDEPTSALDAGSARNLMAVLSERSPQQTIIMANHQLELVELWANRVLYLQNGQLLKDLPANRLNWKQLEEQVIQSQAQEEQEWL